MRKRFVVAMLAGLFVVFGLCAKDAAAISPNLVFSQVKPGNSTSPRIIELYNNAAVPTEVGGWCTYYVSPANTTPYTKLWCFDETNPLIHVFLPAHAFVLSSSTQTALESDIALLLGLGNGTSGHVYLKDKSGNEVDRVGWGTATNAEALHPVILPVSKVVERQASLDPAVLIDTDDNASDFFASNLRGQYHYGALYEVVDVCANIVGIQELIPDGYSVDQASNCMPPPADQCPNIADLQVTIPVGYELDADLLCQSDACSNIIGLQLSIPDGKDLINGECIDHDMCPNVDGIQIVVPDGYGLIDGSCLLQLLPIWVNELLANADGDDNGHEFVELYNPNMTSVDLALYRLVVGIDAPKTYAFPVGAVIAAGQYSSFSDDDIAFTLVNSTSKVSVLSADDQLINEVPAYMNPADGMAWALVGGTWQYTNQPTPASENKASVFDLSDEEEEVTGLKPCASNQYRHPETNRCRLLVTAGSTLLPCKDGQYRSEETNRCRSLSADVNSLTPCDADEVRNPTTNRCRQIASVQGALSPCKAGQERNSDTNRCRNVTGDIPEAAFAVQPVTGAADNTASWLALGGIVLIALAYAVWEWRVELIKLLRKLASFFHFSK